MRQWDAFLPYLAPSKPDAAADGRRRSSIREPVLGSPRSCCSPSDSEGDGDGDPLPNTEDIYDLSTEQLADLETSLSSKVKSKSILTAREERLHKLIRVELSERRGVEEIGLALVGGKFDLQQVHVPHVSGIANSGQPPNDTSARSLSEAIAATAAAFAYKPEARISNQKPPQPPPLRSPSSSVDSLLPSRPGWGTSISSTTPPSELQRTPQSHPKGSFGLLKDFKPTPVNFDFVIGKSSVKKPRLKPKRKAAPEEEREKERENKSKGRAPAPKAAKPPLAPASKAAGGSIPPAVAKPSRAPVGRESVSHSASRRQPGAAQAATSEHRRQGSKPPADGQSRHSPQADKSASRKQQQQQQQQQQEQEQKNERQEKQEEELDKPSPCEGSLQEEGNSEASRTPTPSTGAPADGHSLSPADDDESIAGLAVDEEAQGVCSANAERRLSDEEPEGDHSTSPRGSGAASHLASATGLVVPETEGCTRSSEVSDAEGEDEGEGEEEVVEEEVDCEDMEMPLDQSLAGSQCPSEAVADSDGIEAVDADTGSAESIIRSPVATSKKHDKVFRVDNIGGSTLPGRGFGERGVASEDPSQEEQRKLPSRPSSAKSCEELDGWEEESPGKMSTGQSCAPVAMDGSAGSSALTKREPSRSRERPARQRRPPLPHDALRPVVNRAPAKNAGAEQLDYVGLDPKLVEAGKIVNYSAHFPSLPSLFTWGAADAPNPDVANQRDRWLREALQLFTQFCELMGSLESQFQTNLAPCENSTPNATKQALSAMGTRSAGLYGVFLRGIIDRISGEDGVVETIPEPIPAPEAPVKKDVCALRYYKVVQNRTEVYDIVTRVFHRKAGWEELPHGLGLSNVWNLCWTWSKPKLDYSRLCTWQKVNHFPENKHLTRKDCLKRCVDRYTRTGAKISQYFRICPRTFVLPKEYCGFVECFSKIEEGNDDIDAAEKEEGKQPSSSSKSKTSKDKVPNLWIMKPAGSSRGRGIQVVDDVGSVHYGELTIIQQYVTNPFLINGYKWDMRTYVTVTSFNPLEAFIYKDGFARFTTVPYSVRAEDLDNKLVHLTNSSIQRHNEESMLQGDHDDPGRNERHRDALLGGTKISFVTLKDRLAALGVRWEMVWQKMVEVVLKSLCMVEDQIPHQVNSFELFGYDLLLDSDLRVWLIEVNSSPSMGQEHLLDEQVKQPLISDTIDLVEPLAFDRRKLAHVLQRRIEKKAASGAVGGRRQMDIDLHAIFDGETPRQFGEMPKHLGNYERIAPSELCDGVMRARSMLFSR